METVFHNSFCYDSGLGFWGLQLSGRAFDSPGSQNVYPTNEMTQVQFAVFLNTINPYRKH